jgi:hypothetical protein
VGRAGRAAGWTACALALAALLALALAWSLRPLAHDDLFWHLRAGEWIAAHHRVPLADLFSYTREGARWITHEWGFSLASFLVYRAAGAGGLVALTGLLALAILGAVAWRAVELAAAEPDAVPGPEARAGAIAAARASAEPNAVSGPRGGGGARVGAGGGGVAALGPAAALTPARCLLLAALLAVGLWAASPELFLRAALAGELMLALTLAALARYRRTGRRRWLAATAALFWPWANLHSGVVFGLGLLALYALEAGWFSPPVPGCGSPAARRQAGRRPGMRAAAPYLWTLAAASAATLLNPNGVDAPLYPFLLARILFASGIPWELGHFSASAPNPEGSGAAAWLLVVLLLLALLPLRQARRLSPAETVAIAGFLLLTWRSHRFVFDLVVLAVPVLYKLLALPPPPPLPASAGATAGGLRGLAGRPAAAAALAALLLLPVAPAAIAATAAGWLRRPPAAGGLIAERFPEAAARFIAAHGIAGPGDRIFNHQNYGGFLGWRLRVPIFWDGRNDVFAELVREVAGSPFGAVAERYRFDYLVIAEHDYPGIEPEIAAGRWGLVSWDDYSALYLRRGPRYAPLLGRCELRLFPPFGGRPGLAALAADPRGAAAARAELAQVLAANPDAQRALYFEALISLYRGELRRGAAELRAARRIRPNDQVDRLADLLRHPPPPPRR